MSRYESLALLLSTLIALALSPTRADVRLPEILVSASRSARSDLEIPASISVITRREIQTYKPRNLVELLRNRGGLQLNDLSGNGQNVTVDMRGFGPTAGSNTLILVDGRRLNNSGDRASPDLNSIDLDNVERIEIVQGSAGTLYGNQAVGGMINIITQKPAAFHARLGAAAGDYAGYRVHADIGDRLTKAVSYRLSATKRDNDNYRDNNHTDREDLNARIDYDYASGSLLFEHQYLDDHEETPGSLFTDEIALDRRQSAAAYAGDFSHTRSHISRLGLRQGLSGHWSFEGEATYRDNDREFQTSFRTFPGSPATQERQVRSLNPRFIGTYPLTAGEWLITAGADLEWTDYALHTAFGPQLLEQSIHAYYGQMVLPLTRKWSVTAGLRLAEVENRIESEDPPVHLDDRVSAGAFGMVYRPAPDWRLFLRADQNYRFATVDEHTNVIYGQPVGIDNQTGISYETGIEWRTHAAQAKLVVYRLDLEDEISFDASGFINTNLDRTRRRGVILEGRWSLNDSWSLGGDFTYTDPEITAGAFEDNRIPLVSDRTGRLFSDWDLTPHWSLLIEAFYTSERVLGGDFDNRFPRLDPYTLVNTALSLRDAPWHLTLRINNLLDEEYASSGAIGYDERFTLRDAYFPAAQRNLWLALEYEFM